MKKFLTMALALATMALTGLCASAQTLTVADGTDTNDHLPVYGYNYDCVDVYTHFIYPADMLTDMSGKVVSGVTFYATADIAFSGGTQTVSMMETTENSITSRVNSGMTKVFDGTLTINGDKLVVTFDDAFEYDGGNLLVSINTSTRGTYKNASFYGVNTEGGGYYYYNYSGSTQNFLPKATFAYGDPKTDDARIDKETIDFGTLPINVLPGEASVTISNKGQNAFTPQVAFTDAAFSTTYVATEVVPKATVEIPVKFDAEIGEYTGTMTVDCGEAGKFEVALAGSVIEAVYEVTVADGTNTSSQIPMSTSYWDTEGHTTQVIYNKTDLAYLKGKEITKVKYYPKSNIALNEYGGEATLSMGATDNATFATATALEVTPVGKWVPTDDGALEITLDTPYLYDGESNLVVEFQVTTAGSHWQSAVYFDGLDGGYYTYTSLYKTSSSFSRSNFTPKTTFSYQDVQQPEPEFAIMVTPEASEYNTPVQVAITTNAVEGENVIVTYKVNDGQEMDYTEPFTLYKTATVSVYAMTDDAQADWTGTYTINLPELTMSVNPEAGTYDEAQIVTATVEGETYGDIEWMWQFTLAGDNEPADEGEDATATVEESGTLYFYGVEANTGREVEGTYEYVINRPIEYTITMTPAPGNYTEAQTVMVTVTPELPESAKIVYTFVAAEGNNNAPRKIEGEVAEQDYQESGIVVDESGLLTIIVRDAAGTELVGTEGEYIINKAPTGIEALTAGKAVASIRYYNVAGVESRELQQGVNVVVVTYRDGTQAVAKVVK